jgi:hypothetical protein
VSSHRQQERNTVEQGIFQAEVKMTRVSRRKTLSHSEIESFLNDIDDALDLPAPPNAVDNEKIASVTQLYVPPAPLASPPPVKVVDPLRTEVQSIRDFCKVSLCRTAWPACYHANAYSGDGLQATFAAYRSGIPLEPTRDLCEIGRTILAGSSYPILSRRLLCPNDYLYPSSTIEGKKALLMSLSPMLSEADTERQKEAAACESFTRCKSGKGKSKFAGYDYTDIDVKCQVDFAEYEKR